MGRPRIMPHPAVRRPTSSFPSDSGSTRCRFRTRSRLSLGAEADPRCRVKTEPLSGFALGKQGLDDFAQRQFRIRQITIEPGGVAAFHSHKERPALTYIMKGTLTEHRKCGPDRTYKAGEVLTESTDVDHWAENTTAEPVIEIRPVQRISVAQWDRREAGGRRRSRSRHGPRDT